MTRSAFQMLKRNPVIYGMLVLAALLSTAACSEPPQVTPTEAAILATNMPRPDGTAMATAMMPIALANTPTVTPAARLTDTPASHLTPMATVVPVMPTRAATSTRVPTRTHSPADSTVPLSQIDPWLVYESDGALVVVNADGSGRTVVQLPEIILDKHKSLASSRTNKFIAGLGQMKDTQNESGWLIDNALFILGLPDLSVKVIPLMTHPDLAAAGEENIMVVNSGIESPAWSPDGRRLAFTGAIDGPTADLYVYDTVTDRITRLTDGPNQASEPEWSPNGKWIVHREIDYWGAGCNEVGVWAAAVDGSEVQWLFGPTSCTHIAGWTDAETFIAFSRGTSSRDPRKVNIPSGETVWLYPDFIWNEPYFNPQTKEFMFSPADAEDGVPLLGNAHIIGSSDRAPRLLATGIQIDRESIWLPEMKLLLTGIDSYEPYHTYPPTCSLTGLQVDGTKICFDDYGYPSPSPDGNWFTGKGVDGTLRLYTGDGQFVSEITEKASLVSWQPDSQGLLYRVGHHLYYQPLAGGAAQLICENIPDQEGLRQIFWRNDSTGFFVRADEFLFYHNFLEGQTVLVEDSFTAVWWNIFWVGEP